MAPYSSASPLTNARMKYLLPCDLSRILELGHFGSDYKSSVATLASLPTHPASVLAVVVVATGGASCPFLKLGNLCDARRVDCSCIIVQT